MAKMSCEQQDVQSFAELLQTRGVNVQAGWPLTQPTTSQHIHVLTLQTVTVITCHETCRQWQLSWGWFQVASLEWPLWSLEQCLSGRSHTGRDLTSLQLSSDLASYRLALFLLSHRTLTHTRTHMAITVHISMWSCTFCKLLYLEMHQLEQLFKLQAQQPCPVPCHFLWQHNPWIPMHIHHESKKTRHQTTLLVFKSYSLVHSAGNLQ